MPGFEPLERMTTLSTWLSRLSCSVKGGMKNHDFRPRSRFISETMKDRATITVETNRELACGLPFSMSLNGLITRTVMTDFFEV